MESTERTYTNGEVTVRWKPDVCIHSARCFKGLPAVFDPQKRPWIDMQGASTAAIRDQVSKCPSGALSVDGEMAPAEAAPATAPTDVVVLKDGPLMIKGSFTVKHRDGRTETREEAYLCRCGQSANKPYCDGTHRKCGFRDE